MAVERRKQNDVKPPRKRTQALVKGSPRERLQEPLREGAKKPKCQGEYEQAIEADRGAKERN